MSFMIEVVHHIFLTSAILINRLPYCSMMITPTRRRVRMSKYIAQVNTVGANVGAKLLYFNFIYIKQLLRTVIWRCLLTK